MAFIAQHKGNALKIHQLHSNFCSVPPGMLFHNMIMVHTLMHTLKPWDNNDVCGETIRPQEMF